MSKKVAAIVVTYRRCALLKECIESLLASACGMDIFIIDNHSEDGTAQLVQELQARAQKMKQTEAQEGSQRILQAWEHRKDEGILSSASGIKNIIYFDTGANLGGAGGFQYGLRKAYEAEEQYDYFWLMDDDTMVERDSLTELLKAAEEVGDEFGFLSSLALWTDGNVCNMNYHEVAINWNEQKKRLLEGMISVQIATFVSFLVKRSVVAAVGLPLKEYFIWGDDVEYSKRISKQYTSYLCFRSKVVHKMVQNGGTGAFWEIEDPKRLERMELSIRNDQCTYRRHSKTLWILNTLKLWKDFFYILTHKCSYKSKKLGTIWKGLWKGLFFSPKVEYVNH